MPPAPPRFVALIGLSAAAAAVVIAATLIGFAGRFWWPFDLLSHFRVQYAASLSTAAVALWCLKRGKMAAVAAAFAAVNLLCISWYLAPSFRLLFPLGPRIRVASINVLTSNTRADEVLRFIEDTAADVVFLMEVDDRWVDQLSPTGGAVGLDRFGSRGIAGRHLASRLLVAPRPDRPLLGLREDRCRTSPRWAIDWLGSFSAGRRPADHRMMRLAFHLGLPLTYLLLPSSRYITASERG